MSQSGRVITLLAMAFMPNILDLGKDPQIPAFRPSYCMGCTVFGLFEFQ